MKGTSTWLIALALIALGASSARAQSPGEIVILETTFEGDISDTVAARFRAGLHHGLNAGTAVTVLSEEETRLRLGGEADRLMSCGSDSSCLGEVGLLTGAHAAIVAAVGEAGEIYAFTVDVYDLSSGQGIYFTDADCALCTVDEALDVVSGLALNASEAIPSQPIVAEAPEDITLFIRAEPERAAVSLNGEPIGTGVVEIDVAAGTHRLVVTADGYSSVEELIVVSSGDDDKVVNVRLRSTAGVRGGGLVDNVNTTLIGGVSAGVGLVALVTGLVLLGIDGDSTCSGGRLEACRDVYNTGAGGAVLTVLGTASITAGLALLFWDDLAGAPVADRPAGHRGAGLGVSAEGQYLWWSSAF